MQRSGYRGPAVRAAWSLIATLLIWSGCRIVEEPSSRMAKLRADDDCSGATCACWPKVETSPPAAAGSLLPPFPEEDRAGEDEQQDKLEDGENAEVFGPEAASWPDAEPLPIKELRRLSCGEVESDRLLVTPFHPRVGQELRAIYAAPRAAKVRFALVRRGRV